MAMKNILFIGGSDLSTGLGHVIRCCLTADGLESMGFRTSILIEGDRPQGWVPPSSRNSLSLEFLDDRAVAHRIAGGLKPEAIVIDSMKSSPVVREAIKHIGAGCIGLSPVSDAGDILDYYIGRVPPRFPTGERTAVDVGVENAVFHKSASRLMRDQYSRNVGQHVPQVAVFPGGGRSLDEYLTILEYLKPFSSRIRLRIVLGVIGGVTHRELDQACHSMGLENAGVVPFINHESTWASLCGSSLVICPGGLVAMESAWMGLPFVALCPGAHQAGGVDFLVQAGAGMSILMNQPDSMQAFHRSLDHLLTHRDTLEWMHTRGRHTLSRCGADIVAGKIARWVESTHSTPSRQMSEGRMAYA